MRVSAAGSGLLQRGLQGSGELRDGLNAGKDPEGLEETGPDEDLLLCSHRTCECGEFDITWKCFLFFYF